MIGSNQALSELSWCFLIAGLKSVLPDDRVEFLDAF